MMIGIDVGTTNTAIAVWRDGRPELIPNSLGQVLTPSAVSIDDDGQLLVGMAARERQVTHPSLTATAFKRYMGTSRVTRLGEREFLPEELSALVLARVKADAEHHLNEPVNSAIITVPAYFNDKQRKATRRAGELAGLTVDRLINEPTAAALAYGIHRRQDETRYLVFDLGGGTFDVSILEIFEGVIEVRASTGDSYLGGGDFNEILIQDMLRRFGASWGFTSREKDPLLYELLRDQAERARPVEGRGACRRHYANAHSAPRGNSNVWTIPGDGPESRRGSCSWCRHSGRSQSARRCAERGGSDRCLSVHAWSRHGRTAA